MRSPTLPAGLRALVLALLLPLLLPAEALAGALNHTRPAVKSIARAYGFVSGQGIALDLITENHPQLASQVLAAREAFDSAFPGVEDKLDNELREIFGAPGFLRFRRDMLDAVLDAQMKEPKSLEQAQSFLAEVERRARGETLDKDVLDYLLAAAYAAEPAAEFTDGFRQRFRADGSGKAQGIRLRLQVPRSWAATDSALPHVLQQWTSEGGNGDATIMLGVRDTRGFQPSGEDIARFIAQGGIRELAIEGADVVDATAYSLETLPGYSAVLRSLTSRDGRQSVAWIQMYQIFFRGKSVSLMCQVSGKNSETVQVEQGLRHIQSLCRQVVSSLVMEQLYD